MSVEPAARPWLDVTPACGDRSLSRPIRIVLLDDQSAVRAGIGAIVAPEPGLELVGASGSEQELWPLLRQTQPDVVLLDCTTPAATV